MQTVKVYIDTSIKGPKRRHGAYMYIIAMETNAGTADVGDIKTISDTTENRATLTGLEAALKRIKKPCRLILYLECQYVASALKNKWYQQWREHGWMTAKNEPVCDVEKWRSIEYLLNAHEFEVHLKEQHTYREWMKRTLSEKEAKHV